MRDALFALEIVELELSRETATMKLTISCLSDTLPTAEFNKMCDYAFGQSKKDWGKVGDVNGSTTAQRKKSFRHAPNVHQKSPGQIHCRHHLLLVSPPHHCHRPPLPPNIPHQHATAGRRIYRSKTLGVCVLNIHFLPPVIYLVRFR